MFDGERCCNGNEESLARSLGRDSILLWLLKTYWRNRSNYPKALAQHPNRPLSRERILNLQTRRDWDPFDRSVDLRVMRLRKKIEPDPEHPRFIRTVRNEGYVFVPEGQ